MLTKNVLSGDVRQRTFWPFIVKFIHSDVVSHLSGCSQITSEIGMCRAWVRVTLNEGLFPSYVDAIVGQYNSDDLLRD